MELGPRDFLRLLRRWWWLLLIAPLVTGLAARGAGARFTDPASPEFEAGATLLVNPTQGTGMPTYSAFTYGNLIQSHAVLDPVVQALGLPYGVDTLASQITSEPILNEDGRATELLTVVVQDSDPQLAADIANAVADSFVAYIAQQAVELTGPTRAALEQQITDTQDQIAATQHEIRTLEQAPNSEDPYVQEQLSVLRDTLNQLRRVLSDLLQTAQEMDLAATAAQSQVTVVEYAVVPIEPLPSGGIPLVPLAAIAGLILAAATVLFLAHFDTTVRVGLDFDALVGGPLLSVVPRLPKLRDGYHRLFVLDRPKAEAAEAVRLLRTNIEFASEVSKVTSIAVTSSGPAEGKSTIVANLAVAMAQGGLSVVVIDSDLRNPYQHKIFGTGNRRGLTTLLTHEHLPWTSVALETIVPRLFLVASGPMVPNPADILSKNRLPQLLEELSREVDVVVLDTPPILGATDALLVAAKADAALLTGRIGHTQIDALGNAAVALQRGSVRVIGVVLNSDARHVERVYPRRDPYANVGQDARRRQHLPFGEAPVSLPTTGPILTLDRDRVKQMTLMSALPEDRKDYG
jgi:capsular exopolysaccharide synthesis family protein